MSPKSGHVLLNQDGLVTLSFILIIFNHELTDASTWLIVLFQKIHEFSYLSLSLSLPQSLSHTAALIQAQLGSQLNSLTEKPSSCVDSTRFKLFTECSVPIEQSAAEHRAPTPSASALFLSGSDWENLRFLTRWSCLTCFFLPLVDCILSAIYTFMLFQFALTSSSSSSSSLLSRRDWRKILSSCLAVLHKQWKREHIK